MTVEVDTLRGRLASRESLLNSLRTRLKAAKAAPLPKATISDIQRRYLSAVADLESKRADPSPAPAVPPRTSTDAVSALASRWNKGMDAKKVERASVTVRGDVSAARKNFAAVDAPATASGPKPRPPAAAAAAPGGDAPAQVLVEDDDDGVPSWAKNQQKKVIRKENARSSIRDVDVRELQGSVLTAPDRADSALAARSSAAAAETGAARGNVKAALAMWGKTADEDARLLQKKKEDEERRAAQAARLRREREQEEQRRAAQRAVAKFADLALSDLTDEPDNEVELTAFLERKIKLIDEEIAELEAELEKVSA